MSSFVIREVAGYIVTNLGSVFKAGGSTGAKVPVWLSEFPAASTESNAIALFESGGPPPTYVQPGSVLVERPTIQVISRSTSYVTARSNAQTVWNLLAGVENTSIPKVGSTGVTTYVTISPVQSPFNMGQDAEERNLISANFIAEKAVS